MGLGTWGVEWGDLNGQRAYPLAEDATRTDVTGSFTLPNSFIIGLYLPVHAGLDVEASNFFLQSVSVFPTGYGIAIGYDDGSDSPPTVASASVSRATHAEGDSYKLLGVESGLYAGIDFGDTQGRFALGDTTDVDLQPAGRYVFSPAGGKLDPDVVRPQLRRVSSLSVADGPDSTQLLYGDVVLVPGDNVRISVAVVGGVTQVRIDAVDGAGLTEASAGAAAGTPVMTINGVAPDGAGAFHFEGNACTEVTPAAAGLVFSDSCSAPCCGNAELEALKAELAHVGVESARLAAVIAKLQGSVDQTAQVVLGSRLADNPCLTCP